MINDAKDAEQFYHWLNDSKPDSEKRQRLTCQYNMLRYIQRVGDIEAFNNIIKLVSEDHSELFVKLMKGYINISLPTQKLTSNGNEIHPYLNDLYISGKLDPDVIDILVRRQILYLWQGNNQIHFDLLLPMCHILIKWDHSKSNGTNYPSTVTFNRQTDKLLEFVESDDLPLLGDLAGLDRKSKTNFILNCVGFACQSKERLHLHGIHRDYKLLFSLLKLCWYTKTEDSKSLRMTLMALIISFLKHALLDTYNETNGKYHYMNIYGDKQLLFIFRKDHQEAKNYSKNHIAKIRVWN